MGTSPGKSGTKRGNSMKVIARLIFVAALLAALCSAQTRITGYGNLGAGFSRGLGFNTGDFALDGGANFYHDKYFGEGELGWDSADLTLFRDGKTLRAHGLFMYQAKEHWRFGGGLHYSRVLGEPNDRLSQYWPVAAAMYERRRFRIDNEYLFSVGSHLMTGPLADMRVRIRKNVYFRERFGLFFYHDRGLVASPLFRGGEADFGIMYVFHERPEVQ
jgi:hypothetical protein